MPGYPFPECPHGARDGLTKKNEPLCPLCRVEARKSAARAVEAARIEAAERAAAARDAARFPETLL